jgi:hypothetical protein
MRVELLYFDGCPSYARFLPRLENLIASTGVEADVELRRVESPEAAEAEQFLGSPTVRVDGRDIEPGADDRTDFGLKCRLYRTPDGLRGTPSDDVVTAALTSAG